MYATASALYIDEMGYAMSRLEIESGLSEDGDAIQEDSSSGESGKRMREDTNFTDGSNLIYVESSFCLW